MRRDEILPRTSSSAARALGLVVGAASPTLAAPGDGRDRNAAARGDGNFGRVHRYARMEARALVHRAHRMRALVVTIAATADRSGAGFGCFQAADS
ncbi:hypothetical protein LOK46_08055 [Methylobacterium sp. NMS14P]|uniref:hypothetical protein n=1 Tax=Methylobacterium sp. NMS14P TaxID=2894310 RepID=UPI0023584F33|nr:hypothetical protein [Methylobacterium sp. NMS14P]WCS26765.1 hypothetical protein LOK46_08055 [Methylobacterium sp. NMS14P]